MEQVFRRGSTATLAEWPAAPAPPPPVAPVPPPPPPAVPAKKRRGRRRRWWALGAAVIVLVAFCAASARLFVFPARGVPAHVDAIVMLNGSGDRLDEALSLAWAHRADYLVVSRGSQYWGHGTGCAPQIPRVTVICFDPSPATTKGEAEYVGRLAKQYGWHSMVLVTSTTQDTRARLRVGWCFSGSISVATVQTRRALLPYNIAYEWGAMFKAVVLQPGC